jgi:uncharacterized protein YbjT (DUF2867 family)
MSILITGATGNVGRHVVSELRDSGAAVRMLLRPSANPPPGVDVARGDLSVPASLDTALDGVDAAFLVWPLGTAEGAPAVLDAIARRAQRIVYLSSLGVHDDVERQADPINQFHADIERLIERSGLEWTFLRSAGFATNTLAWAEQIRAGDVVRWPYAAAARSLIHERDIAAVAARALAGNGHGGTIHRLTGPGVLTQAEQVAAIGEAIGHPLRFEEISPEEMRRQVLADGWPAAMVDAMLDGWAKLVTDPEPVTSAVPEITGVPGRTYREWASDHADDFRR